jgi:hypothetical protein
MKKAMFLMVVFLACASFSGASSAREDEGKNVVGRTSDRVTPPHRHARKGTVANKVKRAHPIRRLEGK